MLAFLFQVVPCNFADNSVALSQKSIYITVPSEPNEGLFQAGFKTCQRALPDWYIADDFFKENQPIKWLSDAAKNDRVLWLPAGESSKSLASAEKVLQWLAEHGAKRNESIAVIGGGTVLDLGLFVASVYQRGVQKWSIPTTLLATVDAGIGGKNGVNFMELKNYIGTITQPDVVLSDFRVLETLKPVDVLNGWMEMAKHGLVADAELWDNMKTFDTVPRPHTIHKLIEQAANVKKRLVESDERENGLRKTLNFGHTVGHALESIASAQKQDLPHGIAVGLGMVCSLHWSATLTNDSTTRMALIEAAERIQGWLKQGASEQVKSTMAVAQAETLWLRMLKDKKNDTQGVQEVALNGIGRAEWNQPLSFPVFKANWSRVHADT